MYVCEDCDSEIDDTDILYDKIEDFDQCPVCNSYNVEWYKDDYGDLDDWL